MPQVLTDALPSDVYTFVIIFHKAVSVLLSLTYSSPLLSGPVGLLYLNVTLPIILSCRKIFGWGLNLWPHIY